MALRVFAFVLAVQDLERSARHFVDVLGFRTAWQVASDWRLVERDGVRIMLGHCPQTPPASEIGDHSWFGYVEVEDVDALYREFAARGATCTEPADKPWGMREMLVTTPDGHRLMFGQDLARK
ncbi:MAG TPA: VOC family protein [Stellaceae bacterium]|nr:VOC family protein [Stellaceae bacterium]